MKYISSLALTVALVTASYPCHADTAPHCSVAPSQITSTMAGSERGGLVSGETHLPAPVLPAGNVSRPPLTAAILASSGIHAASSDNAPVVGAGDKDSTTPTAIPTETLPVSHTPVPMLTPMPMPMPIPTPAPVAVSTPASVPIATSGPASLPLSVISSKAIAASPALTRIASKGAQLYALGVSHGMEGVFARHGQYFQVFYITPDGKAAVAGIMWNAHGRNVTLRQVRHIPGLVPTVKIGTANPRAVARHVAYRVPATGSTVPSVATTTGASTGAEPGALPAGSLFEALATSNHGTIGKPGAPRVWMMMDPLCSYSIAAMRQLMPVIAAGQLRVSVVPLSILDYEDHRMSTPEAKIMLSQPSKLMAADWIDKGLAGETADATAGSELAFNMSVARAVHLKGTPTFFWRTKAGSIGRSNGLPPNVPAWIASIRKPS